MAVTESGKLRSLREKLSKNLDENGKLKEQIAKEEQRIRDKEKRDNEKWWRELSKGMEQLLVMNLGTEYKEKITKKEILDVLADILSGFQSESENADGDRGETSESSIGSMGEISSGEYTEGSEWQ